MLTQFTYSKEIETVHFYATVLFGASGAVSKAKGGGVQSVVRNGTGNYTVTLDKAFGRLLDVHAPMVSATYSGVMKVEMTANNVSSTGTFTLQCYDDTGTAVDPASAAVMSLHVVVRNSNVGPWDNL
jgi:hypothetical protein